MINFRSKALVKVICLALALTFSAQQVAFARHENLRDEPSAGDWLINLGMGYMQGRVVNPKWTLTQAVIFTYLIPKAAETTVRIMNIKNETLAFVLQVTISALLQSRFEQAFAKQAAQKAAAEEVTKKYILNGAAIEEKTKEAIQKYADKIGKEVSKLTPTEITEALKDADYVKFMEGIFGSKELTTIAIQQVQIITTVKALSQAAQNILAPLGDKLSLLSKKEIAEILMKDANFAAAIEQAFGKDAVNKTVEAIAKSVKEGMSIVEKITSESVKAGTSIDMQKLYDRVYDGIMKGISPTNLSMTQFIVGLFKQPGRMVGKAFSELWQGIKDFFSNKALVKGALNPWDIAWRDAKKAAVYAASEELLYSILEKYNKDLAAFISGNGAMLLAYYYDRAQAVKSGLIDKDGNYVTLDKEALTEALRSNDQEFWNKFKVSVIAEAIQTAAVMTDKDLEELGIVLSAGTRMLLEANLKSKEEKAVLTSELTKQKETYERALGLTLLDAQANGQKLTKEEEKYLQSLTAEEKQKLSSRTKDEDKLFVGDGKLNDQQKQNARKNLKALIQRRDFEIYRLNMSSKDMMLEGLERGLVSVLVQKGIEGYTKDNQFVSPMDAAYVATGLTGFTQGLFVKGSNISALPLDMQTLTLAGQSDNAIIRYLAESAPQKRVSLSLALMDTALIKAAADKVSMGRYDARIDFDERGLPSWELDTSTRRSMDVFYARRLTDFVRTLREEGMDNAMADQMMSALSYQTVSNIMDIATGEIQKPYVLMLGRQKLKDTTMAKVLLGTGPNLWKQFFGGGLNVASTMAGSFFLKGTVDFTGISPKEALDFFTKFIVSGTPDAMVIKDLVKKVADPQSKSGISENEAKEMIAVYMGNIAKSESEKYEAMAKFLVENGKSKEQALAMVETMKLQGKEHFFHLNVIAKDRAAFHSSGGQWFVMENSFAGYELTPEQRAKIMAENPEKVIAGKTIAGLDNYRDLAGGRHDVVHWGNKPSEISIPTLPEPVNVTRGPDVTLVTIPEKPAPPTLDISNASPDRSPEALEGVRYGWVQLEFFPKGDDKIGSRETETYFGFYDLKERKAKVFLVVPGSSNQLMPMGEVPVTYDEQTGKMTVKVADKKNRLHTVDLHVPMPTFKAFFEKATGALGKGEKVNLSDPATFKKYYRGSPNTFWSMLDESGYSREQKAAIETYVGKEFGWHRDDASRGLKNIIGKMSRGDKLTREEVERFRELQGDPALRPTVISALAGLEKKVLEQLITTSEKKYGITLPDPARVRQIQETQRLERRWKDNPELRAKLNDPNVPSDVRAAIVDYFHGTIDGNGLNQAVTNYLTNVIEAENLAYDQSVEKAATVRKQVWDGNQGLREFALKSGALTEAQASDQNILMGYIKSQQFEGLVNNYNNQVKETAQAAEGYNSKVKTYREGLATRIAAVTGDDPAKLATTNQEGLNQAMQIFNQKASEQQKTELKNWAEDGAKSISSASALNPLTLVANVIAPQSKPSDTTRSVVVSPAAPVEPAATSTPAPAVITPMVLPTPASAPAAVTPVVSPSSITVPEAKTAVEQPIITPSATIQSPPTPKSEPAASMTALRREQALVSQDSTITLPKVVLLGNYLCIEGTGFTDNSGRKIEIKSIDTQEDGTKVTFTDSKTKGEQTVSLSIFGMYLKRNKVTTYSPTKDKREIDVYRQYKNQGQIDMSEADFLKMFK